MIDFNIIHFQGRLRHYQRNGWTNGKDNQGIMDCGNALTWKRIS